MFGRNKQNKPRLTLYERLMGTKEPDIDSIDLSGIDTNNPYFAENTGMDEPQVKISTSQNPRVGGIFPDISAGYQENRSNPISVNNFGNNTLADGRNKGFAYKLGEFGGSLARIADSPLGRGLITGAAIAALGGTPAETLAYGATAGAINQGNRNRDAMYRQQLAEQGINTDGINGYINDSTYKNMLDAKTLQDNAEWRKKYFESQQQQNEIMNQLRRDQLERQERQDAINNNIAYSRLANDRKSLDIQEQRYKNSLNGYQLSTADKKALSENQQTLTDIEAGLQLINENPKAYSLIKGSMPAWLTNRIDPKGISTRTQIDNITAVYRKWLTGAQMSDAERKAYERFLPAPTDNYETVKAKLEGMRASIARKNEIILNNAGLNVQQNDSVNDDPLGIL